MVISNRINTCLTPTGKIHGIYLGITYVKSPIVPEDYSGGVKNLNNHGIVITLDCAISPNGKTDSLPFLGFTRLHHFTNFQWGMAHSNLARIASCSYLTLAKTKSIFWSILSQPYLIKRIPRSLTLMAHSSTSEIIFDAYVSPWSPYNHLSHRPTRCPPEIMGILVVYHSSLCVIHSTTVFDLCSFPWIYSGVPR